MREKEEMNIRIRPEQQPDYHRIAEIYASAFTKSNSAVEAVLVAVHRQKAQYDPELSLVAEMNGNVVGHVLFTPYQMMLSGQSVPAVVLSPIAVDPACQLQGIGTMLIEAGLRRARAKGYEASLVLGHPTYYPRFGYAAKMFGNCRISIPLCEWATGKDVSHPIVKRRVEPSDLPALLSLWDYWFHDCDLALRPGSSIGEWLSTNRNIISFVFTRNEQLLGYVRYNQSSPEQILSFLAADKEAAEILLSHHISCYVSRTSADQLTIQVHPDSSATKEVFGSSYQAVVQPWEAGMIKLLRENELVRAYIQEVSSGNRRIGLVTWPVDFEVC